MKRNIDVMDLVLLIGSLIFLLGALTFLHTCGQAGDGGWMTCHWAGQMLKGLSAVLAVLALIHLFCPPMAKLGMDLAIVPVCLLTALTPGRLIQLCMMSDMRCRSVTAPGALVFAILLTAAAGIDLVLQVRRTLQGRKREKKQAMEQAERQADGRDGGETGA